MLQDLSRSRQQQFLHLLVGRGVELAVLVSPQSLTYFTGVVLDDRFPHVFVLRGDGSTDLIAPDNHECAIIDRSHSYERYSLQHSLVISDIVGNAVTALISTLRDCPAPKQIGVESEYLSHSFVQALRERFPAAEIVSVTRDLLRMRRRKSADEIARIRRTGEVLAAGYQAVRNEIAVGLTEWQVYNVFWSAAVAATQAKIFPAGDFACGLRGPEGGGPTDRQIEKGELFIIDTFPRVAGYHADLCRTFAVTPLTEVQQEAWHVIAESLKQAEQLIRPGARAAGIDAAIRSHLSRFAPARDSFRHHAGHGIGLNPQESPWLIPGSDEVLCEGDVIAVEPGLYSPALQGGLRLEQNYLVTRSGCELLSGSLPLEMI